MVFGCSSCVRDCHVRFAKALRHISFKSIKKKKKWKMYLWNSISINKSTFNTVGVMVSFNLTQLDPWGKSYIRLPVRLSWLWRVQKACPLWAVLYPGQGILNCIAEKKTRAETCCSVFLIMKLMWSAPSNVCCCDFSHDGLCPPNLFPYQVEKPR